MLKKALKITIKQLKYQRGSNLPEWSFANQQKNDRDGLGGGEIYQAIDGRGESIEYRSNELVGSNRGNLSKNVELKRQLSIERPSLAGRSFSPLDPLKGQRSPPLRPV